MRTRALADPVGRCAQAIVLAGAMLLSAALLLTPSACRAQTGWRVQQSQTAADLFSIEMVDAQNELVAGADGTILRTTDGGGLWSQRSSGTTYDLFGVSAFGALAVAVGNGGTILRSTDAGASWSVIRTDWMDTLRSIHLLNAQFAVAGGVNPIFQPFVGITTDGGAHWDFYSFYIQNNEGGLYDVFALSMQTIFGCGYVWDGRGAIMRSVDGGRTWTTVTITSAPVLSIDFPSLLVGYASDAVGRVYRSFDGGGTWAPVSTGTGRMLYGEDFPSTDAGWVVGEAGTIARTTDSGATWHAQSPGGADLMSVDFVDLIVGTTVGRGGRILRTDSGGEDPTAVLEAASAGPLLLRSVGPNPFRMEATVSYRLETPAAVDLAVFDCGGRAVLKENLGLLGAGSRQWSWRGRNAEGAAVAPGPYFLRIRAGANGEATVKLLYLGNKGGS